MLRIFCVWSYSLAYIMCGCSSFVSVYFVRLFTSVTVLYLCIDFVLFFLCLFFFFFFKQKTAYEMRISDWSSDVCSSDLCAECWSCRRHRRGRWWPGVARVGRAPGRWPRSRPRTTGGTRRPRGPPGSAAGTAGLPSATHEPRRHSHHG